jgi:hypothetical protein
MRRAPARRSDPALLTERSVAAAGARGGERVVVESVECEVEVDQAYLKVFGAGAAGASAEWKRTPARARRCSSQPGARGGGASAVASDARSARGCRIR